MVAAVAIVTEQKLIIVIGIAAARAALTFYALPAVLLHRDVHVRRELQTRRVRRPAAVRTRDQLLGGAGLLVLACVAQAEVAVRARVVLVHGHRWHRRPSSRRLPSCRVRLSSLLWH